MFEELGCITFANVFEDGLDLLQGRHDAVSRRDWWIRCASLRFERQSIFIQEPWHMTLPYGIVVHGVSIHVVGIPGSAVSTMLLMDLCSDPTGT